MRVSKSFMPPPPYPVLFKAICICYDPGGTSLTKESYFYTSFMVNVVYSTMFNNSLFFKNTSHGVLSKYVQTTCNCVSILYSPLNPVLSLKVISLCCEPPPNQGQTKGCYVYILQGLIYIYIYQVQ